MMDQREHDRLIGEIHTKLMQIHTVLLGVPGTADNGLCGQVKRHDVAIGGLRRRVTLLVGVLVGSGVLSGATVAGLKIAGG